MCAGGAADLQALVNGTWLTIPFGAVVTTIACIIFLFLSTQVEVCCLPSPSSSFLLLLHLSIYLTEMYFSLRCPTFALPFTSQVLLLSSSSSQSHYLFKHRMPCCFRACHRSAPAYMYAQSTKQSRNGCCDGKNCYTSLARSSIQGTSLTALYNSYDSTPLKWQFRWVFLHTRMLKLHMQLCRV